MSSQSQLFTALSIFALCVVMMSNPISAAPSTRLKRQASAAPTNLTEILSALNLTSYLQNANSQVQQAVQNLTSALQNGSVAFQQAVNTSLANVQTQGQNLTSQLTQFLANLQTQLASSNISSSLNQSVSSAITQLQSFYTTNSAGLQQLISVFGQNITNAGANLQSQIQNLTQYLQSGLTQLSSQGGFFIQSSINSLSSLLNSGALNQTLTSTLVQLQGQTVSFQTALSTLQQNANSSLQPAITNIQNQLNTLLLFGESFFQSLFSAFTTTG